MMVQYKNQPLANFPQQATSLSSDELISLPEWLDPAHSTHGYATYRSLQTTMILGFPVECLQSPGTQGKPSASAPQVGQSKLSTPCSQAYQGKKPSMPCSRAYQGKQAPASKPHGTPVPAHELPLVAKAAARYASLAPDMTMRRKIVQIVGAIESKNNYGAINRNASGGGIAYGSLQVLSRTGGLHQLLQRYAVAGGKYARKLLAFGHSASNKVAGRADFQELLQKSGKDPVMQQVQRHFFAQNYLQPAIDFGQTQKLRLPASYLILFDAFIHYGAHKNWLRHKIKSLVQKQGEVQGMKTFLKWMRLSLYRSYTRTYGANSIEARYNVWRADFLYLMLRDNPQLQGAIQLQAPQWKQALVVK